MTVQQAIDRANQFKAGNTAPDSLKIEWLTEVDQLIYNDVILTHMHDIRGRWWEMVDGRERFKPAPVYTEDNTDEELIAHSPYDVLYTYWLMAKIDMYNNEQEDFNNDYMQYETALQRYKNNYHRNHRSVPTPRVRAGVYR